MTDNATVYTLTLPVTYLTTFYIPIPKEDSEDAQSVQEIAELYAYEHDPDFEWLICADWDHMTLKASEQSQIPEVVKKRLGIG